MSDPFAPETQPASAVPAAPAPATEPVINTPAANVDPAPIDSPPPEPTEELPGPEPEGEPKLVKEVKTVRRRAREAERKQAEAERELEYLRQQQGQQPQQQKSQPVNGEPQIDSYDNYEDYQNAMLDYKLDKREQVKATQTRATELDKNYHKNMAVAVQENEDLPFKIQSLINLGIPVHNQVIEAIKESDVGPQIMGYYADNPNELATLANVNPVSAIKQVVKLESKLSNTKPKTEPQRMISQAPEPITPVSSGGGGQPKALKDMPTEEFAAYRNKQQYG